ncbi:MAG: hypothetical protein K0R85_323 [Devosia sp.]|nr:hypothetical protein [Devosia sp.]
MQFKDTVAVGTQYFFDLSGLSVLYQVQMDNIFMNGIKSDSTVLAKGGIKVGNTRWFLIQACNIVGFTERGVWGSFFEFGQSIMLVLSKVQGYIGTGTKHTNIGVDLAGGDNKIFMCEIGECNLLVNFQVDSNCIALTHLFNYEYSSTRGVVCGHAHKMQIYDNYIDTVQVELVGEASGFNFYGNHITGNKFYVPAIGVNAPAANWVASTGAIVYRPLAAGSVVDNDVITGNTFTSQNGNLPQMITVNTASGTITGSNNNKINNNGCFGFVEKTTEPRCTLRLNSEFTKSKSLAAQVPFGAVRWIQSHAVETAGTMSTFHHFGTLTGDNNVTVYFDASVTCRVRVTASSNTAPPD